MNSDSKSSRYLVGVSISGGLIPSGELTDDDAVGDPFDTSMDNVLVAGADLRF